MLERFAFNLPNEILAKVSIGLSTIQKEVASNINTPLWILEKLAYDTKTPIKAARKVLKAKAIASQ